MFGKIVAGLVAVIVVRGVVVAIDNKKRQAANGRACRAQHEQWVRDSHQHIHSFHHMHN